MFNKAQDGVEVGIEKIVPVVGHESPEQPLNRHQSFGADGAEIEDKGNVEPYDFGVVTVFSLDYLGSCEYKSWTTWDSLTKILRTVLELTKFLQTLMK